MINVIDISEYQRGLDLAKLYAKNPDLGGVIVKATGGVCISQEKTFRPWMEWLLENGKCAGMYHFLDDDLRNSSGQKEAEWFVEKCRPYFGHAIPVLDYEQQAKNLGVGYLKDALDTVYALTGIKPLVYCSKGLTYSMKAIADAGYKLWVAQYANYNRIYGFQEKPWSSGGVGPFRQEVMHQYTSQLYIPGWSKNLDASLFYGDRSAWDHLAGIEPVFPPQPVQTLDDIAREVIQGAWGNGEKRRLLLTEAGWDYDAVQRRVNEILSVPKKTAESITQVARRVISGAYGNGLVRRALLTAAGYDYNKVQAEVNRLLNGG